VLARATAPFVPLPDPNLVSSLKFSEPTVLVRSPFRVQFAYAGPDRVWQPTWRGADKLPSAVRVTVRDAVSGATLAVSSAVKIHVDAAPDCVTPGARNCASAAPQAAATAPQNRGPQ
jgi:general secretion pathway protein J